MVTTSSKFFRLCLSLATLLCAALLLAFSPFASPQAYFVLVLGALPVIGVGFKTWNEGKASKV